MKEVHMYITVFISSISNNFSSFKASKVCIVLAISLLRSLKIQATVKACA
jgi:hypothetical protein